MSSSVEICNNFFNNYQDMGQDIRIVERLKFVIG